MPFFTASGGTAFVYVDSTDKLTVRITPPKNMPQTLENDCNVLGSDLFEFCDHIRKKNEEKTEAARVKKYDEDRPALSLAYQSLSKQLNDNADTMKKCFDEMGDKIVKAIATAAAAEREQSHKVLASSVVSEMGAKASDTGHPFFDALMNAIRPKKKKRRKS